LPAPGFPAHSSRIPDARIVKGPHSKVLGPVQPSYTVSQKTESLRYVDTI